MKIRIYISKISFISIAIVLLFSCNDEINWSPTFESEHKSPFGTYIAAEEMESLFPDSDFNKINIPTLNYFDKKNRSGIYMLIYNENINSEKIENVLKRFVSKGNIAFLSTHEIPNFLRDSIKATIPNNSTFKMLAKSKVKSRFIFEDELFKKDTIELKGTVHKAYFDSIPNSATILGEILYGEVKMPNFIKTPYKNGWFYIHLEPFVFTNISLLKDENATYVERVFSHLPSESIYWDNSRIVDRIQYAESNGDTFDFLSFVFNHDKLTIAFWIIVLGIFLYILFNSSRKQKAIPYVQPYSNDQLKYSESLVGIFSRSQNHKYLAQIKITYFLNYIHHNLYITQTVFDQKMIDYLNQKTNLSKRQCHNLINLISKINQNGFCTKEDFIHLSKELDQFYNNTK